MHPNVAGAIVNSALYLAGVLIVALVTNHPTAWRLDLFATGMAFFSHVAQMMPECRRLWTPITIASWIVAASAGAALLV